MASEYSFDIVAQFDMQEVRNAVDQTKREISTRYDFKDIKASIELEDELIAIIAPSEMQVNQVWDVLLQKVINRKQSAKILDKNEIKPIGGMNHKMEIKLVKALTQEKCKEITAFIKNNFGKVKSNINGTTVRVVGKDKDELQQVIAGLRKEEEKMGLALTFQNYR